MQNPELRDDWQAFILDVHAEQLVFLDESIFKQQTGWRCMAYAPRGSLRAIRFAWTACR